ncbi:MULTISPECIES: hypothetical protein [Pandoraea]|uniref:Uncharacterized protein n=2 Tax=Pandoraea TaxID=93217 RepID=A0A5E4XJB0_9BURK|nr:MULTISPECIES: hypothetical protein [Pandoraea]VVE18454.1 hypothetical protein PCE31107_03021 [Pandoraea cepalis]VVE36268.1 hypothetical protein PTE31013_03942 [Pandoraea terrigena]
MILSDAERTAIRAVAAGDKTKFSEAVLKQPVSSVDAVIEPDAAQFRVGDVWENSRGVRHRVVRVEKRVAHLVNEKTGRTANRAWDDTGWKSGRIWARVESAPTSK